MGKRGLLIAGVGLPGVGKSTILKALAQQNQWQRLAEPEEIHWPASVSKHDLAGVFTALTWFRTMRVQNLYYAAQLREQGHISLVDCYYDKLMMYYIEQPQMDWLISPEDPYFDLVKRMAAVDNIYLPTADVIIFLTTTFESWEQLILTRKRQLDLDRVFPHAFSLQAYLNKAVQQECDRSGSRLIIFENQFGSIERSAEKLNEVVSAYI